MTGVPSQAPFSVAPTSAPTELLGSLAKPIASVINVREDETEPFAVLAIAPASNALGVGEVAKVWCSSSHASTVSIVGPSIVYVQRGAAPTLLMARPIRDTTQIATRYATINCAVSAPGRPTAVISVTIAAHGVAQPSFKSICSTETGASTSVAEAMGCATSSAFTTNGNTTIVIGGGTCDSCPQPPFDSTTTVRIGGVAVPTTVSANGLSLVTRTPSIMELLLARGGSTALSDFSFGYVNLTIENEGFYGSYGGAVSIGPGALGINERLACAVHGFCPEVAPHASGIFYTQVCDGFANPTEDASWNITGESAQRFAYVANTFLSA